MKRFMAISHTWLRSFTVSTHYPNGDMKNPQTVTSRSTSRWNNVSQPLHHYPRSVLRNILAVTSRFPTRYVMINESFKVTAQYSNPLHEDSWHVASRCGNRYSTVSVAPRFQSHDIKVHEPLQYNIRTVTTRKPLRYPKIHEAFQRNIQPFNQDAWP